MSGMLGRGLANVPALGTQPEVLVSADGSKRFCKAWPTVVDLSVEPTSVLDIRSPSPSSTLSSSVAASSESGLQGSSESVGAVAVSGRAYESSEGQLVDCTSLLEGGTEDGSLWGLDSVKDGEAERGMVRPWQANPDDTERGWERNVATHEAKQYIEASHSSIMVAVPGRLASGDEVQPLNPGFMQGLSMPLGKQGSSSGKEFPQQRAERLRFVSPGLCAAPRERYERLVGHRDTAEDESLEACVLSCRKREREDSLGEVVQRLSEVEQKVEAGEWLADWTEFGDSGEINRCGEEKVAQPGQVEDLDDIFGVSPPVQRSAEFWLSESTPLMQQLVQNHGRIDTLQSDNALNLQSSGKVQLDLFEAVQAGLLFKGGGPSGSGFSPCSVTSSPRPANVAPSVHVLPRSFSTNLSSPLSQSSSLGNPPLLLPFQRHLLKDSTPRAPAFLPGFLDSNPPPPPPPLLNATFAPAPPHFTSQVQLPDLPFPLPAVSFKKCAQSQQGSFCSFSRPEQRLPRTAGLVDQKLWHPRAPGDGSSKVSPGGPKWQLKPEPGWQSADRVGIGSGHARGPHLSPHLPMPSEHAPRSQVSGPEHVGRSVRLEELSLAERLLCAASEAAQLGELSTAQAILARLNQQSFPSGQQQLLPARRVALLFGEALSKWVAAASSPNSYPLQQPLLSNPTFDLISKISAFKKFCEISPISQFAHFTANQAILDAMDGEDHVHLIDFELGFGGQWASFIQEISQRSRGPPELKITTMGTDTLETRLVKENLLQFAKEVGMKLEVNMVPVQKLEGLKALVACKNDKEAMGINFGFGMNRFLSEFLSSTAEVMGFLQMVKGLCPKVVTVVDSEFEFEGPSAYMDALQFYSCVFESLESSSKLSTEVVRNIESLVFGPKICDFVNARQLRKGCSENGLPPWRILLQKAGFTPLPVSTAAESQVSWLVKNPLNTGFSFLKQHATLLLAWYSRTLVSTSAWV